MNVLAGLAIASLMLQSGLESTLDDLFGVLRDRSLLTRALLINIVVVPLVAAVVCRVLALDAGVTTGIILMAVAPGVPSLPFAGGPAKGGHLSLAIGLVFVFNAVSVVTAPFIAQLLLPSAERIELPIVHFISKLVLFQLLPLALGLALGYAHERTRALFARIARVLFIAALLCLLAALIVPLTKAMGTLVGSRGLLAIAAIVVANLILGWIAGGNQRSNRITLSLATALRNPGMAALIGTATFGGTIVVPTILAFLLVQILLTVPVGIYFKRALSEHENAPSRDDAPREAP